MSASLAISPSHDGLFGGARYRAMFAVALSVLLSVLDYAVVNVALPTIAHDVHTTESSAIWVVNAYQLASLISLLPLAAMGDRVGHGRMCRIGLVLFVIASVLCAISQTLPELAAARALQGFGGACIMSVNAALVRFIYPNKELGRGIALNGLVVALGVALGPDGRCRRACGRELEMAVPDQPAARRCRFVFRDHRTSRDTTDPP